MWILFTYENLRALWFKSSKVFLKRPPDTSASQASYGISMASIVTEMEIDWSFLHYLLWNYHWIGNIVILIQFSPLGASEVVIFTPLPVGRLQMCVLSYILLWHWRSSGQQPTVICTGNKPYLQLKLCLTFPRMHSCQICFHQCIKNIPVILFHSFFFIPKMKSCKTHGQFNFAPLFSTCGHWPEQHQCHMKM